MDIAVGPNVALLAVYAVIAVAVVGGLVWLVRRIR